MKEIYCVARFVGDGNCLMFIRKIDGEGLNYTTDLKNAQFFSKKMAKRWTSDPLFQMYKLKDLMSAMTMQVDIQNLPKNLYKPRRRWIDGEII